MVHPIARCHFPASLSTTSHFSPATSRKKAAQQCTHGLCTPTLSPIQVPADWKQQVILGQLDAWDGEMYGNTSPKLQFDSLPLKQPSSSIGPHVRICMLGRWVSRCVIAPCDMMVGAPPLTFELLPPLHLLSRVQPFPHLPLHTYLSIATMAAALLDTTRNLVSFRVPSSSAKTL